MVVKVVIVRLMYFAVAAANDAVTGLCIFIYTFIDALC